METSLYREVERETIRNFNLRCIDGSLHGCGRCMGYCAYDGHAGFLSAELQDEHQCIEKGCFYHSSKPKARRSLHDNRKLLQRRILLTAQDATAAMEGLCVIRVAIEPDAICVVYYAAIAQYDVAPIAEAIAASTGYQVTMKQIPCDFDVAVALVMSQR